MSQSLLIKKTTVRWRNKDYWTQLAFFSRVLVVINAGNNDGSGRECSRDRRREYWSGDIDEHIAQVINAEEKYADNDDKANRFAVEQFHQELSSGVK